MLKKILIKCTQFLGRDDLSDTLNNIDDVDQIENSNVQNDILRLINFFNYTTNYICENYLDLSFSETFKTDSEGKIYFYNFYFSPVRILNVVSKSGKRVVFEITPSYMALKSANSEFFVTYKYTPNECLKLTDKPELPPDFNVEIICYGVVSEFLAAKGQYAESEFWKKKFLNRLFRSKIHKERRLKSTFLKWNKIQKFICLQTLIFQ